MSNADCDDSVGCTFDTCGVGGVCEHTALDERCADGETCDTTQGCLGSETCEEDVDCDDGVECTVDTCAVGGHCAHNAVDAICGGGVCDQTEGCVAALDGGADGGTGDTDGGMGDTDGGTGDTDGGTGDTDGGVDGGSGECGSLMRCGGRCVDTSTDPDACGSCDNSCTPGEACIGGSCTSGVTGLVLSELRIYPSIYFELYNGSSTAIDLDGYQVQWQSDVESGNHVLPSFTLAPGEFVTLRGDGSPDSASELSLGSELSTFSRIAVQILQPGGLGVDYVKTGTASLTPATGTTWTGDGAENPARNVDQALVRNVYAADTDTNADWSLTSLGSPGEYCRRPGRCGDSCYDFGSDRTHCGGCGIMCSSTQVCRDGTCTAAFGSAWLSEVRRYPVPGLEVHNPSGNPVVLTGWSVEVITSTGTGTYDFDSVTLEPGEFLWLYAGAGADDGRTLFTDISSSRFERNVAIALLDDAGQGVDFVRFGSSSASPPAGTAWLGDNVPAIGVTDSSARRNLAILDTNSASDWVVDSPSTPGFSCWPGLTACSGYCVDTTIDPDHCGGCGTSCDANESCVAGSCDSVGAVVLSELLNYGSERIEVFNGTGAAVDLEGWSLQWTADGGSGSFTIPALGIPSGGVVAFSERSGTSGSTFVYMATAINWTADIAITLRNAAGDAVDFVKTGSSGTSAPGGTSWTGDPALAPSDTESQRLYRSRWAADTDSAADWFLGEIGDAGSGGTVCESEEALVCGGGCISLPSTEHCTACGNVCPVGTVCGQTGCDSPEGALRIASDDRLEIHIDGEWRSVCDDAFDDLDARVVCRQWGMSGGTAGYSLPDSPIPMYSRGFLCGGSEERLSDCSTTSYSCVSSETVTVDCTP